MASASRVTVVERGMDPSQLPLFSFGGAGPVHACRVAMALGSPSVIIPAGAGVMSAAGFLDAPLAFDFVRTRRGGLSETDWAEVNALFAAMEAEGVALLAAAGVAVNEVVFTRSADARYIGQGYEIRVGVPNGVLGDPGVVVESFGAAYAALYGRLGPDVAIEITAWRWWRPNRGHVSPCAHRPHPTPRR